MAEFPMAWGALHAQAQPDILPLDTAADRPARGLVHALFLVGAFLAPLNLVIRFSFTVYDALTAVIAFLLVWDAGRRGPRLQFLSFRLTAAAYVFLLFAVLSTLRSTVPTESLTQVVQFAFVFFIQIPVILTLARSPSLFRASLILFLCGALVGMLSSFVAGQVQGAGRTLIFYSDNPNRLGYPTAYILPFVLYLLIDAPRSKRAWATILALPAFYLMIWALAASGSRSATVATPLALVAFLSFHPGLHINFRTALRFALVVMLIGLLAYGFYESDLFPSTLHKRIDRTLRQEASLTQDRLTLADAGWRAFEESPLVGVGLDNFRYVATRYLSYTTNQLPHNMWLQFLAQIGLVGTLAFLALMAGWFVTLFRAQRATRNRSQREMLWAFLASMIAILTIYMFVPIMIERHYWLIFGLGLALADYSRRAPRETPVEDETYASRQASGRPARALRTATSIFDEDTGSSVPSASPPASSTAEIISQIMARPD